MAAQEILYVNGPRRLEELLQALRESTVFGFDTEFVGEGSYEPLLCLIQIAAAGRLWIVDPLALSELGPFWELVTAPEREMIALAAREEIRFCLRYAGRTGRILDPQIGAGLVGYAYPLSHTNLVRAVLGVEVDGRETFTDWRRRPLSDSQIEYAADDVRYLLALRERLLSEAEALSRTDWIETECRRLVERVEEGEREERWWKVSGSGGLGRRELAVLRELWRWRDGTAREANVPPRRILRDELLVEIAKRRPTSVADLLALRGLERGSVRRAGPDIVKAVQDALALPKDQWPVSMRRDDPPQVQVLSQLISVVANGLAAQHRVDSALLATSADLQELVRWRMGLTAKEPHPFVLDGWRGVLLGKPLLEVLEGRRGVRVADLRSPNPLEVEM